MLFRLPPDPPEKWRAVQPALESTSKTLRFCLILVVGSVPPGLILAAAIVLARR